MKVDWKSWKLWVGIVAVLWLLIGQFGKCSLLEPLFFLHAPWRLECQNKVPNICLGCRYDAGTHLEWKSAKELDIEENFPSYRERALHGDLSAQMDLANHYWQDDAEAEKWFRMAAEQGDADAENALGHLYEMRLYTGHGHPQDKAEAAKWYRKAAEQGDRLAIAELSGVDMLVVDNEEGYFWTYISACLENSEAVFPPGVVVASKEIASKCPSPYSWGLGPIPPSTRLESLPAQQLQATERRATEWILAHKFKPSAPHPPGSALTY